MALRAADFPDSIRVKLNQHGEKILWKYVEERGGIKEISKELDYSASKIYNWRNKDVFLPINFVSSTLEDEIGSYIIKMKGRGRSLPLENPELPMPEIDELLTRFNESGNMNKNGVPIYCTKELSLAERFQSLLQVYGDVPFKVYSRSVYEVRFPKYMVDIFEKMSYDSHLSARIDESAEISDGKVILDGKEIEWRNRDLELYSREKRYKIALMSEDSQMIENIIKKDGKLEGLNRQFQKD